MLSCFNRVRLFAILRTGALQALLSMGFSRQEYWSGLPFPSPGKLPDPGIKPRSPALQGDCLPTEPLGKLTREDGSDGCTKNISVPNASELYIENGQNDTFCVKYNLSPFKKK